MVIRNIYMRTYKVQSIMDVNSSYSKKLFDVVSELMSLSSLWLKRLTIIDKVFIVKFATSLFYYLQSKIDKSRLYKYTSNTISPEQISKYEHFIATLLKHLKLTISFFSQFQYSNPSFPRMYGSIYHKTYIVCTKIALR